MVWIHRALPASAGREHGATINAGDWVTTSRDYALEHAQSNLDPNDSMIVSRRVPAGSLYSEGNSIHEWAYNGEPISAARSPWGDKQLKKLRQASDMNMSRQVNKLRQRADNARRLDDPELGDYFDYLQDKMQADAQSGRRIGPASEYIPWAQEEFGDERVDRIIHS
jgi:hypothetical protein